MCGFCTAFKPQLKMSMLRHHEECGPQIPCLHPWESVTLSFQPGPQRENVSFLLQSPAPSLLPSPVFGSVRTPFPYGYANFSIPPTPSPQFINWFQDSHFLKTKNFPLSSPVPRVHCGFLVLLPKLPEGGRLASFHPPPRTSSIPQSPAVPWLLLLHLLDHLQAGLLMTS